MKLTLEEKLINVKFHINDGIPLFEIQRTRGLKVLRFCIITATK